MHGKYAQFTFSDTSPASNTTSVSALTATGFSGSSLVMAYATLTGATGGTLDVTIEGSWDEGTTWNPVARFPQITAAAAAATYVAAECMDTTIQKVGASTTGSPVALANIGLSAGTVAPGKWPRWLRVVYYAGTSTSAGAAQVIRLVGFVSKT